MEWFTIFMINWILNIIFVEKYAIGKIQRIIDVDEERDEKYKAFRRIDVFWFNRPWLYATCHFAIIKIIFTFSFNMMVCSTICRILTIGKDYSKPFTGIHYWLMRANFYWGSRLLMWCSSGIIWVYEEKPKICYKKYLGPDWVADYDWKHCGSTVTNHSSFLDSMLHGLAQYPTIIAKIEVKNIPFIGPVSEAAGNIHIDRSCADSKRIIQDQIIARQTLAEEDENWDPVTIHAEGGTTNNQFICKFKRGAFVGLKSIYPKVHIYHSHFQSASSGVIDGLPHYIIGTICPWSTVTRISMPIFRPNEFFFKNHQKEGEERWQTYMRTIRQIMSDESGIPLIDQAIEQKFEYKGILYPDLKKWSS